MLKKYRPEIEVDSAAAQQPTLISKYHRKSLSKANALKFLKNTAESIDQKDLKKYDLVVVMDEMNLQIVLNRYAEYRDKVVFWNINNPNFLKEESVEKVFKQIRQKVKELAYSL